MQFGLIDIPESSQEPARPRQLPMQAAGTHEARKEDRTEALELDVPENLFCYEHGVTKAGRALLKNQVPCVLWFMGVSGAGKSTIANLLEKELHANGYHTYVLDGDNLRHGINRDLGFNDRDRAENIRRVAEIAKLMLDAGLIVITAFISPFRVERQYARELVDAGEFIEIFVNTPLHVAEARDPKGLYKKARLGQIKNFTGIDSPYEAPLTPEIVIDTTAIDPSGAVQLVISKLSNRRITGHAPARLVHTLDMNHAYTP